MPRTRNRKSKIENRKSQAADFLFEIGTEELPAAYLPDLIIQLKQEAAALLTASHLPHGPLESFGTPRRLVFLAHEVAAVQQKPAVEIRGPSKQAAFDSAGKPTGALLGFLRSQQGRLDQTKSVPSDRGEYVYLVKPPMTTPTAQVLPELLSTLLGRLKSPKTMRWDASGVRFARPIRWLLALYGAKPVRLRYGHLASSPYTWVGRPVRRRRVPIRSIDQYVRSLKTAGVILDQVDRQARIDALVRRQTMKAGGRPAQETATHGLLDEVTHLVEQPVPLPGRFDRKYLELPREVLLASMAKYQRVFAVEAASGHALLPQFVAILEGTPGRSATVRAVIERILNARLADSLLFLAQDRTHLPLERMASSLSGVTFHERIGSMAEKSAHLRSLIEVLADAWQLSDTERAHLHRAAELAKADLVSTMVKEFPTLQGVIGRCYAAESGEPAEVATAIEEHYLPLAGKMPKTLLGSALAMLDKCDTLISYCGIGIMPTGDQDPFGLRRAAQGIVEVAWVVHRPLPLARLLSAHPALSHPGKGGTAPDVIRQKVQTYLLERLYTFPWPAPAPAVDYIDAVLELYKTHPCDDVVDAMDRIVSLQRLKGHPGLLKAAKVIERTRNILKGAALRQPAVDPDRLQEPLERQLWDVYRSHEGRVAKLAQARSYGEATTVFGDAFFEPLHQFFDHVLVNVPDEPLQQNRLALMSAIHTLYTARIADLSKLTVLQHEEP